MWVRRTLQLALFAAALIAHAWILGWAGEPFSAVSSGSVDPEVLRARGSEAMQNQQWAQAISHFESLTKATPEDGAAWLSLGRARQSAEEYEAAIEAYSKAAELGGQGGVPFFRGALCSLALGDPDRALTWVEKLAATGSGGYRAVLANPAFEPLEGNPRFVAALEAMKPCNSEEHRQFDFWVGDWEVTAGGQPAGKNRISSIYGGCSLQEEWRSTTGNNGTSLTFYDATRGKWHQTWIDNSGNALYLDGRFQDGAMVLESDSTQTPWHRVTWSKQPGGKVRQLWEASNDGGESWGVLFDGLYAPAGAGG